MSGDIIQGTGGARTLRFPRRGGGKPGGYGTILHYGGEDVPVFLLALIDKGVRSHLSKAERNELAAVSPGIADAYRSGAAQRAGRGRSER